MADLATFIARYKAHYGPFPDSDESAYVQDWTRLVNPLEPEFLDRVFEIVDGMKEVANRKPRVREFAIAINIARKDLLPPPEDMANVSCMLCHDHGLLSFVHAYERVERVKTWTLWQPGMEHTHRLAWCSCYCTCGHGQSAALRHNPLRVSNIREFSHRVVSWLMEFQGLAAAAELDTFRFGNSLVYESWRDVREANEAIRHRQKDRYATPESLGPVLKPATVATQTPRAGERHPQVEEDPPGENVAPGASVAPQQAAQVQRCGLLGDPLDDDIPF